MKAANHLVLILILTACTNSNVVLRKQSKIILQEFMEKSMAESKDSLKHNFLYVQLKNAKGDTFYSANANYALGIALPVAHNEKSYQNKIQSSFDGFQTYFEDTTYENSRIRKLFKPAASYIDSCEFGSLGHNNGFPNWTIVFNDKNEVIQIFPQQKEAEIRVLLESKGIKFSKNYLSFER